MEFGLQSRRYLSYAKLLFKIIYNRVQCSQILEQLRFSIIRVSTRNFKNVQIMPLILIRSRCVIYFSFVLIILFFVTGMPLISYQSSYFFSRHIVFRLKCVLSVAIFIISPSFIRDTWSYHLRSL